MFGLDPAGELTLGSLIVSILVIMGGIFTSRRSDRESDKVHERGQSENENHALLRERVHELRVDNRNLQIKVESLNRQLRKWRRKCAECAKRLAAAQGGIAGSGVGE